MVLEKGLRGRICRKVSESLVYLCIFVHFSLELVSRFKSGKGGMVAVKHKLSLRMIWVGLGRFAVWSF